MLRRNAPYFGRHCLQRTASSRGVVRRRRRRGISLMEVLFAMGIMTVGLVGVAVLIPVAGRLAQDGTTADRASREGLNAVREMELRGMARPQNWVHLGDGVDNNGNNNFDEASEFRVGGGYPMLTGFCLDPRFVAGNMTTLMANTNGAVTAFDPRFFPYVTLNPGAAQNPDPSGIRMRRISLYRGWGNNGADDDGDGATDELDELALGLQLSEDQFVSQDDLVISIPGVDDNQDPLLPTQQVYGPLSDKRQYEGRISWMATFAPRTGFFAPSSPGNPPTAQTQDTYIMSVVVFNNRDSAMTMDDVTERVAFIPHIVNANTITATGFHGGGVNGGDVSLMVRPSRTPTSTPPIDPTMELNLKRGQWVMLARNSPLGPLFRWYKVTEVDPGIALSNELSGASPPAGIPIRHVTLSGPDWPVDPSNPTLVYIVPGVISVYEKTIRLENTSLWTQ